MYHSPLRREQAEATRERILDAAEKHLASDPDEISYVAIAKHAGVSLPTVHRQFPDRRSLYEGLMARADADMRDVPFPTSSAELTAAIPTFVARWASKTPLEEALSRSRVVRQARRDYAHGEKRALLRGLFADQLKGLTPGEIARFEDAFMFLSAGSSVHVLTQSVGLSVERASAVLQLLLAALGDRANEIRRVRRAKARTKERKTRSPKGRARS